jgi:Leucine-rich repeat (LRR) protein
MFHHFPALQELSLSSCPNLTTLPEGIEQLSSLQSLKLVNCDRISALPEWLSNISSLRKLVIRGCKSIVSLPACIQQLTNLQKLLVERNQELQQWCHSEENKATLAHIKHKIISDQTVLFI